MMGAQRPRPVVALVGVGKLGETLLAGLLAAGHGADRIRCVVRRPERADELRRRYGVTCQPLPEAIAGADVVVLMCKPYDIVTLAAEVGQVLRPGTTVVSVAAGVPTVALERVLPATTAVVRVMPNTPAQIRRGVSALSAGAAAGEDQLAQVTDIFAAVGTVVVVPEADQDAVTGLSGSGPAYIFYVAEAMIEAGKAQGLSAAVAERLVIDTIAGAAALLRESDDDPVVLRQNVTSPGGTTAAGLAVLEERGMPQAIQAAVAAARARSAELAN